MNFGFSSHFFNESIKLWLKYPFRPMKDRTSAIEIRFRSTSILYSIFFRCSWFSHTKPQQQHHKSILNGYDKIIFDIFIWRHVNYQLTREAIQAAHFHTFFSSYHGCHASFTDKLLGKTSNTIITSRVCMWLSHKISRARLFFSHSGYHRRSRRG